MENQEDLFHEAYGESRHSFFPGYQPSTDDKKKQSMVYLDYAGTPLVSKPFLKEYHEYLMNVPQGNPHSSLSFSNISGDRENLVEAARQKVLQYFGLSSEHYMVVFTSGTTASLRLVNDLVPWSRTQSPEGNSDLQKENKPEKEWEFWSTANIHTSVLGLKKELFRVLPSESLYPTLPVSDAFRTALCSTYLKPGESFSTGSIAEENILIEQKLLAASETRDVLMALPAEDNFSGSRLNYRELQRLLSLCRANNCQSGRLWWLLDAAKLSGGCCMRGETQMEGCVNLSALFHGQEDLLPDFLTLSFYKIFGFPTGLGALLIKKKNIHQFQKNYFGGGTWLAGSVLSSFQVTKPVDDPAHYEDGTLNFQAISSLQFGFRTQARLGGPYRIERHNQELFRFLLCGMQELRHSLSKAPLCQIYLNLDPLQNETESSLGYSLQGAVITFNLTYANGSPVSFHEVKKQAEKFIWEDDMEVFHGIFLRTGCFCNIGGCQSALGINDTDSRDNFKLGRMCGGGEKREGSQVPSPGEDQGELDVINNKNTGACRVSLGYGSTLKDCEVFLAFLREKFLDRLPPSLKIQLPAVLATNSAQKLSQLCDETSQGLLKRLEDPSEVFLHKISEYYPLLPTTLVENFLSHNVSVSNHSQDKFEPVKLHAIYVYPIKSCAGVRVSLWPLQPPDSASPDKLPTGLLWDRLFAIQETDENGFVSVVTLKRVPHMSLLQPSFITKGCLCHCSVDEDLPEAQNVQDLSFFNNASVCSTCGGGGVFLQLSSSLIDSVLQLPLGRGVTSDGNLDEFRLAGDYEERVLMNICGRKTRGVKVSYDADEWITRVMTSPLVANNPSLGKKYSLIRCSDGASTDTVKSFANTAQYLMLSLESIQTLIGLILGSYLDEEDTDKQQAFLYNALNIKAESFRPNIIVSGGKYSTVPQGPDDRIRYLPHQEDTWKTISLPLYQYDTKAETSLGGFSKGFQGVLNLSGPCSRCSMVNVNASSGLMDCRIFEALKEYRKSGSRVYFGQFLELIELQPQESVCSEDPLSKLLFFRVGDHLEITHDE